MWPSSHRDRVVANLDEQDLLAIVAYLASRDPSTSRGALGGRHVLAHHPSHMRRLSNWGRPKVLQKQDTGSTGC